MRLLNPNGLNLLWIYSEMLSEQQLVLIFKLSKSDIWCSVVSSCFKKGENAVRILVVLR